MDGIKQCEIQECFLLGKLKQHTGKSTFGITDVFSIHVLVHVQFLFIFLWREIVKSCWTQSEQVKNRLFERGCRWFQLFLIDFQLFYFLTRIIKLNDSMITCSVHGRNKTIQECFLLGKLKLTTHWKIYFWYYWCIDYCFNVQRAVLKLYSRWEQVQQFIKRIYNVYINEGRDEVNGVNNFWLPKYKICRVV
jgi:hypothetical protein